jgi:hypothetical protein
VLCTPAWLRLEISDLSKSHKLLQNASWPPVTYVYEKRTAEWQGHYVEDVCRTILRYLYSPDCTASVYGLRRDNVKYYVSKLATIETIAGSRLMYFIAVNLSADGIWHHPVIHPCCSLSCDRLIASSRASSPQSVIYCFIFQFPLPTHFLKVFQ